MNSLLHEKPLPRLSSPGALVLLLPQRLAVPVWSVSDRPRLPRLHRFSHSLQYTRVCRRPIAEQKALQAQPPNRARKRISRPIRSTAFCHSSRPPFWKKLGEEAQNRASSL